MESKHCIFLPTKTMCFLDYQSTVFSYVLHPYLSKCKHFQNYRVTIQRSLNVYLYFPNLFWSLSVMLHAEFACCVLCLLKHVIMFFDTVGLCFMCFSSIILLGFLWSSTFASMYWQYLTECISSVFPIWILRIICKIWQSVFPVWIQRIIVLGYSTYL